MAKEKDFANVAEMSERFNLWCEAVSPLTTPDMPVNSQALIWQARAQMAIAQQLTLIAKHLGKIVANAEDRTEAKPGKEEGEWCNEHAEARHKRGSPMCDLAIERERKHAEDRLKSSQ